MNQVPTYYKQYLSIQPMSNTQYSTDQHQVISDTTNSTWTKMLSPWTLQKCWKLIFFLSWPTTLKKIHIIIITLLSVTIIILPDTFYNNWKQQTKVEYKTIVFHWVLFKTIGWPWPWSLHNYFLQNSVRKVVNISILAHQILTQGTKELSLFVSLDKTMGKHDSIAAKFFFHCHHQ